MLATAAGIPHGRVDEVLGQVGLADAAGRRVGEGRTVLVSSHVLAEVAQTVDQVVIIARGRLVAQSTLADLTAGAATLSMWAGGLFAAYGLALTLLGTRLVVRRDLT